MALGAAQIEFMLETKLWEEVAEKGEYFRGIVPFSLRLSDQLRKSVPLDCVGEVRGLGLMIGVELVDTKVTYNANSRNQRTNLVTIPTTAH